MRYLPFILLSTALLSCTPQRLLKGTTLYISGMSTLQYMSANPQLEPPVDPMQFSDYYANTLQQKLSERGIKSIIAKPGEQLPDLNNKVFALQLVMTMMQEMPGEAPVEDLNSLSDINTTSAVIFQGNDKSKTYKNINLDIHYTLTAKEQNEFKKLNPNAELDSKKLAIDKICYLLAEEIEKQIISFRKKNK